MTSKSRSSPLEHALNSASKDKKQSREEGEQAKLASAKPISADVTANESASDITEAASTTAKPEEE